MHNTKGVYIMVSAGDGSLHVVNLVNLYMGAGIGITMGWLRLSGVFVFGTVRTQRVPWCFGLLIPIRCIIPSFFPLSAHSLVAIQVRQIWEISMHCIVKGVPSEFFFFSFFLTV